MTESPHQSSRHRGLKVFVLLAAVMIIALPAMAAKGGSGGGKGNGGGGSGGSGGTSCSQSAPRTSIDNTWAWGSPGSWGTPGQQLTYAIDVFNNDVGCGSTSFTVDVAAPAGFTVSIPTNTITLASASTGYVWAHVTSPASAADGSYVLTSSIQRAGASAVASGTSYYKVYSSDTVVPKIFWENPTDGGAVSGSPVYVGFTSTDDHAVKKVDVSVDGAAVASTNCDNISSSCQVSYAWSTRGVSGQHTATLRSTDWMGNVETKTVTFTVN
jgi:hypothetical protein